jgi:hypothetical protein
MTDANVKKGPDVQFATALVYWGAAFLVLILGFRAILETLELASLKMPITYLAVISLVAEFSLLLYYGNTIRLSKPKDQSSVFPPQLTAELEVLIGKLSVAAGEFVDMAETMKRSAGEVERKAVDLSRIADQSLEMHRKSAEDIVSTAKAMQAANDASLASVGESLAMNRKVLESAASAQQNMQNVNRQAIDAFLRSTQAFQEFAASFKAPLAALETTARDLNTLTEQEYKRRVLADIMLGLNRTVDDIKREQSKPGSPAI